MKKNITFTMRMTGKLYRQLTEYAKRNDGSIASLSATKALEKFIIEENSL